MLTDLNRLSSDRHHHFRFVWLGSSSSRATKPSQLPSVLQTNSTYLRGFLPHLPGLSPVSLLPLPPFLSPEDLLFPYNDA